MKTQDEIIDSLQNVYKQYSEKGDADKNIEYVNNKIQIELLCDIRDLLTKMHPASYTVTNNTTPIFKKD